VTKTVKPTNWFGIIIIYTALTLLCVYLIPVNSAFSAVRVVLAVVFVVFVPGYCLVSFLFQEGKVDFAEELVLSIALSFSIAGISGLFLGLSPLGFNFDSITLTAGVVTVFLAVLTFLRKMGLVRLPSRKFRVHTRSQITA
jgi:uncharacterized membrane protein